MANSRASLASDYLDNFYASLPPRCSQLLKVLKIVYEFIFYNEEGSSFIKCGIGLQLTSLLFCQDMRTWFTQI